MPPVEEHGICAHSDMKESWTIWKTVRIIFYCSQIVYQGGHLTAYTECATLAGCVAKYRRRLITDKLTSNRR